jgi:hypothetical protein
MTLVAQAQRDHTVATLRDHYLRGRLTVEEFGVRAERALSARTSAELRTALRDLPLLADAVARGRVAVRVAAYLAVLASLWMVGSIVLLVGLAVALAVGAGAVALAVTLLWALLTGAIALRAHRRIRRA